MPNLKVFKDRISSIKSTRRITSAMKMVAAAKLRRAQERVYASRPYAQHMETMISSVVEKIPAGTGLDLMVGRKNAKKHLLIVITSDKGLCGGFNTNIVRNLKQKTQQLQDKQQEVSYLVIGQKGTTLLKENIFDTKPHFIKHEPTLDNAEQIMNLLINLFNDHTFDIFTLVYTHFISVLQQETTYQQIIPFTYEKNISHKIKTKIPYEFEPSEEYILSSLLPKHLSLQIFRSFLSFFISL